MQLEQSQNGFCCHLDEENKLFVSIPSSMFARILRGLILDLWCHAWYTLWYEGFRACGIRCVFSYSFKDSPSLHFL